MKQLRFVIAGAISLLFACQAWGAAVLAPPSAEYLEASRSGGMDDVRHLMDISTLPRPLDAARGDALPSRYDLRARAEMTSAKDQGRWNTCWAFAAIGAIESNWRKRHGTIIDLSERHLDWFSSHGEFVLTSGRGGLDNFAVAMFARWSGPVAEISLPYANESPSGSADSYRNELHLQHAYMLALEFQDEYNRSDIETRKRLMMAHGGLSVGVRSESVDRSEYFDAATNAGNFDGDRSKKPNHAVVLCGWDDYFPRDRFPEAHRPDRNGAWLVKNSRGPFAGDGGYSWVSYEDRALCDGVAYICGYLDDYDKNYGYDDCGWAWSASIAEGAESGWIANVFTAGETDEILKAVSFYTTANGARYEIRIWTDLTSSTLPTSDTQHDAGAGEQKWSGYHTVELENGISIKAGSKFAVAVKLTTPGYGFPLPIEVKVPDVNYYKDVVARQGESFMSADGASWSDLTVGFEGKPATYANACIKAFTWKAGRTQLGSTPPNAPEATALGGSGGGGCSAAPFAIIVALGAICLSRRQRQVSKK